jgi:hypothetical protein
MGNPTTTLAPTASLSIAAEPPLRPTAQLKAAVLARRPEFRRIVERDGVKDVWTYVHDAVTPPVHPQIQARQKEFLDAFEEEAALRLDAETAQGARKQLETYYTVSTMDHCGPLHHPWAFHFHLLSSLVQRAHPDPNLRHVITLSFSNVSLNNFSFPRGITFNAAGLTGTKLHRLGFFLNKMSPHAVFGLRPYAEDDLTRMRSAVATLEHDGEVTPEVAKRLQTLIHTVFGAPAVLGASSYGEQITRMNALLWDAIHAETPGKKVKFVYLEQEHIVSRLLLRHHLAETSPIGSLILDQAEHTVLMKHFDRVHDCFCLAKKKGTYLFWALPKGAKHRLRLWKRGSELVSDCGTFRVALTAEGIAKGLEAGELIPSTMLSLILLSFHYGLHCLGGMGQVSYLPEMHAAYLNVLRERGDMEGIRQCEALPLQDLGGEMQMAFMSNHQGEPMAMTAVDLFLYGKRDTLPRVAAFAKSLKLSASLDPTLPPEYPMLYQGSERQAALMAVSSQEIVQDLHRQGLVQFCGDMHVRTLATDSAPAHQLPPRPFVLPTLSPKLAYYRH